MKLWTKCKKKSFGALNVLHLISALDIGGSETMLVDLLEASRDEGGVDFVVVVMNRSVHPALQERLERTGISVYFFNRPEGHKHIKYLWMLWSIIRRHRIRVVHVHNYGGKMWGMLCRLLTPGLRLVLTVHDVVVMPSLSFWQVLLHRMLMDMHVAISKPVADTCVDRGIHRYRRIYNGVPLARFARPNCEALSSRVAREDFRSRPMHIVNVARLSPLHKGQDVLLEAVALCKRQGLSVRCTLMGGVSDYNRRDFEQLRSMVAEAQLEDTVQFIINRTDVPVILAEADIFVMPSRYEGFGLAAVEAMAAGVPVIASAVDGLLELVEDGVNGLQFESGNAADLAAKIARLYHNPKEADRLRERALILVRRFDISVMREHYELLYRSLTGLGVRTPKPSARTAVRKEESLMDIEGLAKHRPPSEESREKEAVSLAGREF